MTKQNLPLEGSIITHDNKQYTVSNDKPNNFDLVITPYGVWTFKDETGFGSAPLPYWANKSTCKKLIY